MANIPTPHIDAREGEIATTVLMAGDPLRVKFMAEKYLENPVQFNSTRGMLGYTGLWNGKRVSLMGHGMGMPSMGIYSYELLHFYGVDTIIRMGSAGAMSKDLNIGDLILAQGACTNSAYAAQFELPGTFAPIADFGLLRAAAAVCEARNIPHRVGNVITTDLFYSDNPKVEKWREMGVLAVEMETAALYMNAARAGARSLALLSISDNLITGEVTSAEHRRTAFTRMVETALALV